MRKTLERLILKGIVKRVDKGLYSYVPHKTLDVFTSRDTLAQQALADITAVLRQIRGNPIVSIEFLEKLKAQDKSIKMRRANPLKGVKKVTIGGSAADDSSRLIKAYANWSRGSLIRASARVRLAGIAPLEIHVTEGLPKIDLQEIKFIPEHIERGRSAEFVLEKLKRPFIEKPITLRDLDIDFNIVQEFARKISDYELIEFNQDVIELALAEAKRKSTSSDIAIAFIDGSILPEHLDPKIHPNSRDLDKWPPEMAKQILKRKEKILRRFLRIYEYAHLSENIILVGAIKNSNDMSLQAKIGAYYDAPDQVLLINAMRDGEIEILGPFKKHRVEKVLVNELKKFNIEYAEDIAIDSFYVKGGGDMLPLQLDIVFPENTDDKTKDFVLDVIYHLTEISEKHRKITTEPVSTLKPLNIVDKKVSDKSLEIEIMIKKELEHVLYNVMELLARYVDIGIAIFALKLDSWSLERLM